MKFLNLPNLPDEIEVRTLDNYQLVFLVDGPGDWLYSADEPELSFRIVDTSEDDCYWIENLQLDMLQRMQRSIYNAAHKADSPKMIEIMAVQLKFHNAQVMLKASDISKFIHRINNTRAEILSSNFGQELSDEALQLEFFSE